MKSRFCLLVILLPLFSLSQSFDWWSNNVHWDGTTNWWKYLITTAKYFGPNAFTVPAINNGSIDSSLSLAATASFHFSGGDNTQNITLYGNYTTKKNTISIDAQFVPYEKFELSHAIKTERKVYYKDYNQKTTAGDVIVNTRFQLFEKLRKYVQLAMRVGLRMPSGGVQGAARYADTPGYWIDLGFAIPLKGTGWKMINMAGFFCYETNDDDLRQDDAFLYGSGFEYNRGGFRFQGYLAGYLGYFYKGDRPMVIRANLEKNTKNRVFVFRLQQGLHDFSYFTVETGIKFLFGQ